MNISFNQKTDPSQFRKIREIGKGGFGCVFELEHIPTGLLLAGKQINEENLDTVSKETLKRENNIMKQIISPYAVRYYGEIQFEGKLTVLMDFCDRGSLRDIMDYTKKTLTEQQIAFVMHDLLNALNLLHTKLHIVHRDIKAANILVTSKGEMKLTDFGVSRQFAEDAVTFSTITTIGTPYWMAPEVVTVGRKYTFPADIWSTGATALELAEGGPPYCEYDPYKAMIEIRQHGFPGFRQGSTHSAAFQNFVNRCMTENPKSRPKIPELLRDPFIRQIEQLDRMEVLNDLIQNEIDFTKLLEDEYEYEEEEEEEEEAEDTDDGDQLKTINYSNQTIISSKDDVNEQSKAEQKIKASNSSGMMNTFNQVPFPAPEAPDIQSPSPEATEIQSPPLEVLDQQNPTPETPISADTTNLEESTTNKENLPSIPKPPESENQKELRKQISIAELKNDEKIPKVKLSKRSSRTKKFSAKTKIPKNNAGAVGDKLGYRTFIPPSKEPTEDLYVKTIIVQPDLLDEPQEKKSKETVPVYVNTQPVEKKGKMNKLTFFGFVLFLIALLYLLLGTKKFVLILLLLLPLLFLARNLF